MDPMNDESLFPDAPQLAALERARPFQVPEGYFDDLQERIQSRIAVEKYRDPDALRVPEGYWETMAANITARIAQEESAPEPQPASMPARLRVRRLPTWVSYAAAACISVVVGTGIYLNTRSADVEQVSLSAIPDLEIVRYLQVYADAGDAEVVLDNLGSDAGNLPGIGAHLTDEDLRQYLDTAL